ncbi:hypothetical protein Dsin_024690 [Dipteronia sinensis]|uniref:DUF4283 domain-containing protein n=1 Tax=Dipteronia sinensis TaxID=43782 RepID=A0AAE0DW49_9ROSI|nr:hypothetical protein Dsin_024690 [Dipteronia sinensis]
MEEIFKFSAQPELGRDETLMEKLHDIGTSVKRARTQDEKDTRNSRKPMLEDMEFVLTEGLWLIANQYLVVQKWRSTFVPGEEEIQKMPVWARLSKLPME